jgi:hypothetical protein
VVGLFAWLNFEYSRDAYEAHIDGAHRGGLRHGFPLAAWDGGDEASASIVDEELSLKMGAYGGWQFGGLAVDILVFIGALAAVCVVSESLAGNASPQPAQRGLSLHPAVYPVIFLSAAALLWANTDVRTRLIENKDGTHDFQQDMGWPFCIYLASNPNFEPVRPPEKIPTKDERLLFLQANSGAWFKRAHWNKGYIVLNIVTGLTIVLGLAGGIQFFLRRPENAHADVVQHGPSD